MLGSNASIGGSSRWFLLGCHRKLGSKIRISGLYDPNIPRSSTASLPLKKLSKPNKERRNVFQAAFFRVYSMVVSGSPKRWDQWHIIPQLAGKIPLILYTTYSPCRTLGVKNATYLPPFRGTISTTLDLHTRKLTWNLKIDPWKRRFLFKTIIFRFHVSFRGGMLNFGGNIFQRKHRSSVILWV